MPAFSIGLGEDAEKLQAKYPYRLEGSLQCVQLHCDHTLRLPLLCDPPPLFTARPCTAKDEFVKEAVISSRSEGQVFGIIVIENM
jgi:hypothetical protein